MPITLAHGTWHMAITAQEDGPGSVPCWERSWVLGDSTNEANTFF